jgi:hypothetical protein
MVGSACRRCPTIFSGVSCLLPLPMAHHEQHHPQSLNLWARRPMRQPLPSCPAGAPDRRS